MLKVGRKLFILLNSLFQFIVALVIKSIDRVNLLVHNLITCHCRNNPFILPPLIDYLWFASLRLRANEYFHGKSVLQDIRFNLSIGLFQL